MKKRSVLLVEDDPNLGALLSEYLLAKGFDVRHAIDGQYGLEAYKESQFDFIILDIMMPRMDGFALAKHIRSTDSKVPVLFLSAKTMKEDKLKGFGLGADDYLTKPFSMEELLARMEAILRRHALQSAPSEYDEAHELGKFMFDPKRQELKDDEQLSALTTKEAQLLQLLSANRNEILPRETALKLIWGDDTYHNGRSMDVYITKLRKHLRPDSRINILNVHGEGYRLLIDD